jgi:Flp pilus assembly protein TadG
MPLSLAWHSRDDAGRRKTPPLRRFPRATSGATAVEFALIAPVFLGLLFGILEVALTFWSTQVLETAVANAARQIYTGSFQQGSTTMSQADALVKFKDSVCANVTAVFNCRSLVKVDVRRISSYASAGASIQYPVTNGAFDPSKFGYDPPGANEICVVRAAMEYPVYVNLFGYSTGLRSGNRLIIASSAFKTEPF